ncbi:hypothetical protein C1646_749016 [Rhizophagus diaphanus]|nr:hypothetical protein C1646_749016 [Rhizophagus diaphanus] [Rhizophagus sp. MUCL 43196]
MSVEASLKTFLLKRISKANLKSEKIDAGDIFTDYFKIFYLSDIILWWMDEKELYEEANVEEIMMSYFKEKFYETSNFIALFIIIIFHKRSLNYLISTQIFWSFLKTKHIGKWLSWYIHTSYMSTRAPVSCPFRSSSSVNLPEYVHYLIIKEVSFENIQLKKIANFISSIIGDNQQNNLKVWYYETNSVHVTSIVNGIDFTVTNHFGHAFGFKRSFYIDDNLNYCLLRVLLKAGNLSENYALMTFRINEEKLCQIQDYLKIKMSRRLSRRC